jgi:RNA polymerase sigma-70 factor, ECF subfamily
MTQHSSPSSAAGNDHPTQDRQTPGQPAVVELTALVVAHHAAVYRYACRLCGCPTEAEDLTQQTFLVAQRKLHQLREAERACSWLLAIVRSCFLKSIRKVRPRPAQDLELDMANVADPAPEVEEIDRDQLAAALAELPEEFRLVLLMFYFEELSYQQIAEQLEVPVGTVMSRLSRAKGHLRRRLAPQPEASEGKSSNRGAVTRNKGNGVAGPASARVNH